MSAVTRIKKNTSAQFHSLDFPEATEFLLEEGAQLTLYQVQTEDNTKVYLRTKITQMQNSALQVFSFFIGNPQVTNDLQVDLEGEEASARFYGLYALKENQKATQNIFVYHKVPHTKSYQLCKSILQNHSQANFGGKIRVEKDAQKTEASQLNKNLILGPKAKVDTNPFLEILADDVKCSHGATVGRLDFEEKFYLQSRGIPEKEAQNILIRAFAEDVLKNLNDVPLKNNLSQTLEHNFFGVNA